MKKSRIKKPMEEEPVSYLQTLPLEVQVEFMRRLPYKDAIEFCKTAPFREACLDENSVLAQTLREIRNQQRLADVIVSMSRRTGEIRFTLMTIGDQEALITTRNTFEFTPKEIKTILDLALEKRSDELWDTIGSFEDSAIEDMEYIEDTILISMDRVDIRYNTNFWNFMLSLVWWVYDTYTEDLLGGRSLAFMVLDNSDVFERSEGGFDTFLEL
jgi:hypothetical protein